MKPYDWCDPRCPEVCSCEETIEAAVDACEHEREERTGCCRKCGVYVAVSRVLEGDKP